MQVNVFEVILCMATLSHGVWPVPYRVPEPCKHPCALREPNGKCQTDPQCIFASLQGTVIAKKLHLPSLRGTATAAELLLPALSRPVRQPDPNIIGASLNPCPEPCHLRMTNGSCILNFSCAVTLPPWGGRPMLFPKTMLQNLRARHWSWLTVFWWFPEELWARFFISFYYHHRHWCCHQYRVAFVINDISMSSALSSWSLSPLLLLFIILSWSSQQHRPAITIHIIQYFR